MPDFDIDFCQDGRDRVIDYVRRKYGAQSVSQIATFGTMAAKAAIRDVGRVLDLPYPFCDGIAKLIPFQPGKLITLKQAREMEPLLAERERNEEEVRALLALAESVEGLTRNVGMHAGGVLIAPGKLTDFCPLYAPSGADGAISQYDKDDVEAIGLVKFDFLGPDHAHHPRPDARLHPQARSDLDAHARGDPARRPGDLQALPPGAHLGGVPVRIARHARPPEAGAAGPPRRPDRAQRALPAGADGADPRVRRAQARPRARRLPRPAARDHPGTHLRRHGVPGAGDADRAGHRRLHARQRRPAAPRDGQEEARGDGEAARQLRRRRGGERADAREGGRALRPDGEVRRLRLQQVALGRLRAHRLPDRVAQGPPSGRVPRREPVAGDGRHRQGARAARRRAADGPHAAAARRQRVDLALRAGRSRSASATGSAASRAPASRPSRRSSRRARAAARSATWPTSRRASTSGWSTAACSRRW